MSDIKGYELFQQKNFELAIKAFEKHLEVQPKDIKAIYHLAICYRRLNDHIKTLDLIERACKHMPNDADLISERGVSKFHINDKSGALDDMNICVDLQPKNPYRYSSRAYIKANMNDINSAISDYEKAIELDPEDAVALNNLGMLEERLGRMSSAKKRFDISDKLTKDEQDASRPEDIQKLIDESKPISKEDIKKESSPTPDKTSEDPLLQKNEKLSTGHFFKTLKYVFGSKEGRNEFISFLKKKK